MRLAGWQPRESGRRRAPNQRRARNERQRAFASARAPRRAVSLKIVGIAGSLRKHSLNRALLLAAVELCPSEARLEIADIGDLPLYNGDVEAVGAPAPVTALRHSVKSADALFLVTPEYNFSIPGVLKNAIDWLSRPPDASALDGKPLALASASPGGFGGVRAQLALRQVCVFTNMYPLNDPALHVSAAHTKFDDDGNLTDDGTKRTLRELLQALIAWTKRLGGNPQG